MAEGCPLLTYRETDGERTFGTPRAYCTAVDRFVQPMRADVCNDRFDLHHAEHCEIYREHEGETAADGAGDSGGADG